MAPAKKIIFEQTYGTPRADRWLSEKRIKEKTNMSESPPYLMESLDEITRLEIKTDPEVVRQQAQWCGVKPGMRVLDAGCGPGKTTAILSEIVQPGGSVLGIDYSRERILHAKEKYGMKKGIDFQVHDFMSSFEVFGNFDLIWLRFILEYYREESPNIVNNVSKCLKPDGYLCLIDLDNNCLNHYQLTPQMKKVLRDLMAVLEEHHNFDPYAGRKLYSYLYDLHFKDIKVQMLPHHLIYGQTNETHIYNWLKKSEMASRHAREILQSYPGGQEAFFADFMEFFCDPRRFTYTPLIMCKGSPP